MTVLVEVPTMVTSFSSITLKPSPKPSPPPRPDDVCYPHHYHQHFLDHANKDQHVIDYYSPTTIYLPGTADLMAVPTATTTCSPTKFMELITHASFSYSYTISGANDKTKWSQQIKSRHLNLYNGGMTTANQPPYLTNLAQGRANAILERVPGAYLAFWSWRTPVPGYFWQVQKGHSGTFTRRRTAALTARDDELEEDCCYVPSRVDAAVDHTAEPDGP
ncbi:hypothetical protein BDK51DRAFT_41248 [Blyttiomyces helicus]|uniref:Uncharacterized protein n=1 Tax=Blyttiomyces helicus TaxID=388810 RepID=A0A4P9WM94_9FUNG|nr:hypothetical protein BDK51DRAFT_41248 [Blyttiomyces helicus]|eukprot:RKO94034.1 hypothetical protein BDK51DRAFT_41248 [Blyttiomyces helicus]